MVKKSPSLIFLIVIYHPDRKFHKMIKILKDFPFLIVDNSEKENTLLKKLPVIRTGENLGYAAALNIGLKKIMEDHYLWIILVNQDLSLTRQSVKKLIARLSSTKSDLVGLFPGNLDRKRYSTILPARDFSDKKLLYLSGALLAIRTNVLHKIGLWEEKYFLYYEDVDFCQKAIRNNLHIEVVALPEVEHEESKTLGKDSFLHQYYLAKNHLLFVERNAPLRVKVRELVRLPKTIFEHWSNKEKGGLLGIKDYFFRKFGMANSPTSSTSTSETTTRRTSTGKTRTS